MTKDQEKMLTHSGRREQRELARRLRERFPGLLDQPFNKDDYLVILFAELGPRACHNFRFQFRSTNYSRTRDSAEAYVEGAFPDEVVEIEVGDDDEVLRVRLSRPVYY